MNLLKIEISFHDEFINQLIPEILLELPNLYSLCLEQAPQLVVVLYLME